MAKSKTDQKEAPADLDLNLEESTSGELITVDPQSIQPAQDPESGPMKMLAAAVEKGADMAQIEKLMDLAERHEANQAKKAFTLAMANFKANAPILVKDSKASFDHKEGDGKTEYKWASLAQIASKVAQVMGRFGLSHHWDIDQGTDQGKIIVTCVITHALGHSESTTMKAAPETSGKKNPIQQTASAITYMERYTLLAACGLAAADASDDDGNAAGSYQDEPEGPVPYPDERFKNSFPNWEQHIKAGTKTVNDVTSFLATRGFVLTESQLEDLNELTQ